MHRKTVTKNTSKLHCKVTCFLLNCNNRTHLSKQPDQIKCCIQPLLLITMSSHILRCSVKTIRKYTKTDHITYIRNLYTQNLCVTRMLVLFYRKNHETSLQKSTDKHYVTMLKHACTEQKRVMYTFSWIEKCCTVCHW
jgi:hypothetical protein